MFRLGYVYQGTAEVVFSRRGDGLAAVKRYNNVELDGKPMKIEIVGTNVATAGILPPVLNGIGRNPLGPRRYSYTLILCSVFGICTLKKISISLVKLCA